MNIEYAKDPCWADEDHTMIDLIVKWKHLKQEHPFTASPNDPDDHGKALFEDAVAGKFGEVKEYIVPEPQSPILNSSFPTPPSGEIPVVIFN